MDRTRMLRSSVPAAFALLALAGSTHAQDGVGPFVGGAVGVSRTSEPSADLSRVSSSVDVRAGWALSPRVAVMLESAVHGPGGKAPEDFPASTDPAALQARPRSERVGVISVVAAVQVATPGGTYVRPGVGMAQHSFDSWLEVLALSGTPLYYMGNISYEWAPAATLAVGKDLSGVAPLPLSVEAVALWSGGEDSTGQRWSLGLQLAYDIHFRHRPAAQPR